MPWKHLNYKKALGVFDKTLLYSVLQSLPNMKDVTRLINKAVKYLGPGGKMLIGDIPNSSLKKRFLSTKAGKIFDREWNKNRLRASNKGDNDSKVNKLFLENASCVLFDDAKVLGLIEQLRNQGLHAFILPQPMNLPFGNTREDLLVIKP